MVVKNKIRQNSLFFAINLINSHAGGVAVARLYGFEINFVRNPISGSDTWIFIMILKFIFTLIFEIKIHEKKFLDTRKISFSKPNFHKPTYATPTAYVISDPASASLKKTCQEINLLVSIKNESSHKIDLKLKSSFI